MRVLIVDDEPPARRGVALRLRKFPHVHIVGQCSDGRSAVRKILELKPDVVFLDVQMPGMDGFDVLRALDQQDLPYIIFLTAYEQYALRAFEVHALDYLLKPVDDERFTAAVERATRLTQPAAHSRNLEGLIRMLGDEPRKYRSHFVVRTGTRIQIVPVSDVEWIAADGDYAQLRARGRTYLLRETMSALQAQLDPAAFLRIHRSRIVRTASITELRGVDNGEYEVTLADGSRHRSSRTYAAGLEAWLAGQL